ncbi:MAG: hypothetical protein ABI407_04535 [Bradyrhizobium sp.]
MRHDHKKALANYCAQHADQIEINKKVVSAWDEALAEKARVKRLRWVK